ncbi:hypothetical protein N656DRAFT_630868 [Canariomyces notabilis]|uniref:Uncharacterized protein n=1 Tax=Canariomyces notabilis TaxID=2074819 RepID=A0AAN6YU33_9PEZI|nr:hypothetical protein N656DRAFT_630868 [Canariomyces arenarius]
MSTNRFPQSRTSDSFPPSACLPSGVAERAKSALLYRSRPPVAEGGSTKKSVSRTKPHLNIPYFTFSLLITSALLVPRYVIIKPAAPIIPSAATSDI